MIIWSLSSLHIIKIQTTILQTSDFTHVIVRLSLRLHLWMAPSSSGCKKQHCLSWFCYVTVKMMSFYRIWISLTLCFWSLNDLIVLCFRWTVLCNIESAEQGWVWWATFHNCLSFNTFHSGQLPSWDIWDLQHSVWWVHIWVICGV